MFIITHLKLHQWETLEQPEEGLFLNALTLHVLMFY